MSDLMTKKQSVLTWHGLTVEVEVPALVIFEHEEDEGVGQKYLMNADDWRDMGEPKTITLTIESGDLLNQEE